MDEERVGRSGASSSLVAPTPGRSRGGIGEGRIVRRSPMRCILSRRVRTTWCLLWAIPGVLRRLSDHPRHMTLGMAGLRRRRGLVAAALSERGGDPHVARLAWLLAEQAATWSFGAVRGSARVRAMLRLGSRRRRVRVYRVLIRPAAVGKWWWRRSGLRLWGCMATAGRRAGGIRARIPSGAPRADVR